jgi:hypothetical protein
MAEEKQQPDISFHRSLSHLRKGGLHKALGVDPNTDIPKDKVEAATHSKNGHVRAMSIMAQNMDKWHKG